jgi:hypothetical protein
MYYHEAYIYSQTSDGFMETGKAKTEQEDLTANIFSIENTTIVGTLYFQMACSFEFRLFYRFVDVPLDLPCQTPDKRC